MLVLESFIWSSGGIMFRKTLKAYLVLNHPSPQIQVTTTCNLQPMIFQRSHQWFLPTYK
ncbi:hypothetical protein F8388_017359 [Cannabis sativa]|uniref:Uncharacterized protein n=1 Tax=Cannabis sativa TaxID=3483 RepID=A0A7J6H925_CANSA|nr:hypothetical protein F8388_017359 [Cannabis sativa]